MSFGKVLMTTLAAGSMIVMPTVAQAASSANRLSVSSSQSLAPRASAKMADESNLAGGSVIIAILAAAAVIAGIVIATDGDSDPVSP